MPSLGTLAADATALLGLFASQLEVQGVDVPSVQYVAPGNGVVFEQEALIVTLTSVEQGVPGAPNGGVQYPPALQYLADFRVTLVRPVAAFSVAPAPGGNMVPAADDMNDDGLALIGDLAAIAIAAAAIRSGYLWSEPGVSLVVGPVQTLGPDGGMAGAAISMSVALT